MYFMLILLMMQMSDERKTLKVTLVTIPKTFYQLFDKKAIFSS